MSNNIDIENGIVNRYNKLSSFECLGCGNNLKFAGIKPGNTVLDLGCGSGKALFEVVNIVGPTGRVIGIDISPGMIQKAAERLKDYHNVILINEPFDPIPLPDQSIDILLSNCTINHIKDKENIFNEIYRVLKYTGSFVISDIAAQKPLPTEIKDDPEQWADCFGGAITEEEYLSLLESSPFKNVTILEKREYTKKGYDFVSLTFLGTMK